MIFGNNKTKAQEQPDKTNIVAVVDATVTSSHAIRDDLPGWVTIDVDDVPGGAGVTFDIESLRIDDLNKLPCPGQRVRVTVEVI